MDVSLPYHVPVMLQESLEGLAIRPEGVYADLTFGGGGHSKAILAELDTGQLYAFDQDEEAHQNALAIEDKRFHFIQSNFRYLKRYLKLHQVPQLDGLLADLGVSSHQFDAAGRGFSTRFEARLDMRMDTNLEKTAYEVVNTYPEEALHRILGLYGELTNARTAASLLVRQRVKEKIETTTQLREVLRPIAPCGKENKYFAQVFQALRIEVNDELKALEEMLLQSQEVLKPGGRLVVISYHSLEDRLVKHFIQKGKFIGEAETDLYGNRQVPFLPVSKGALMPAADEIDRNARSRSAKLRVAVRV
jgi:16S rRNA (cytosine1402-N4)-methyltransferase